MSRTDFLHCWLLVITRTSLHEIPEMRISSGKKTNSLLLPMAGMFNHSDSGCNVAFAPMGGYTIRSVLQDSDSAGPFIVARRRWPHVHGNGQRQLSTYVHLLLIGHASPS
ncbi:hypothetical protein F5Y15DRAFT_128376 [Xylariaceae sp. FL0016]|nr:hypothetical protein F5Y15DRAFT_128376 [Xylariaceae sp. FL0016]